MTTDFGLVQGLTVQGATMHSATMRELSVQEIAKTFAPISLDEMEGVALQDRQETKYVFSANLLADLLAAASAHYRLLTVADERFNRYRTLYFDTPALDFYQRHLSGAPIRTKVRSREYLETQTAFLEVKQRTNRKRTIKHRMPTAALVTRLQGEHAAFVSTETAQDAGLMEPVLWNGYTRLTLVGITRPERVTLDLGLQYRGAGLIDPNMQTSLEGIVIAEVKQPRIDRTSPVIELLRLRQVRPSSFSKYCMGVSLLMPGGARYKINKTHRLFSKLLS